ncbi:serine/threonine-protein kinase pim-2-like isoform X1 [Takifugu flavidus]|uniref:non-specific serine/threonine protein kinase n=1 Tax=Takifugu flavidus TaxID=433684 RepID=A0A5C6PQ00_9TELE|nr:serine/threonine-protein kinase pim-2-like isoform X1 [Takifugu flavidus]TWW81029.1 Hormonally up-regulated neu tumor-associated kinase [Takifugu flavidus]
MKQKGIVNKVPLLNILTNCSTLAIELWYKAEMGVSSNKRKHEESSKSENSTSPSTSAGDHGRVVSKKRKVSSECRRTAAHRTVCSEPTPRVGLKEASNLGRKRKAQSDPEALRKRQKTESVTVPHNVSPFPELQPSTISKTKHVLVPISREEYQKQYIEVDQLGEGGFGTVYSGYRRDDLFPVAIKHIDKDLVKYQPVVINGELHCVPLEMVLMAMTAGDSVGENAVISPLAWTSIDDEVLLIMERPEYCMDLLEYDEGQIDEGLAKEFMRQLVEAAIQIHMAGVFHRDFKLENILIQDDEARLIPRVRVIDFGCGCFVTPGYRGYVGTSCYEPPEFNHRGTYEAGPTTVWQLGCILLQLLSEKTDLFTTGMQHCENFLTQTIMELKVSEDCKKFLMSCFLFNPDQRITLEQMRCHPWFCSSVPPEAQL